MKAAVTIPVTVKCRIGIDDQDPEAALDALADAVVAAGVDALIVHARKAWLQGLSPRENREVPPLDYARVYRLKERHPGLPIVLNGGIDTLEQASGASLPPRRRHDGACRLSRSRGGFWTSTRSGARRRRRLRARGRPCHDPLHRARARRRRAAQCDRAPHARACSPAFPARARSGAISRPRPCSPAPVVRSSKTRCRSSPTRRFAASVAA